jgi:hypothetical protein
MKPKISGAGVEFPANKTAAFCRITFASRSSWSSRRGRRFSAGRADDTITVTGIDPRLAHPAAQRLGLDPVLCIVEAEQTSTEVCNPRLHRAG